MCQAAKDVALPGSQGCWCGPASQPVCIIKTQLLPLPFFCHLEQLDRGFTRRCRHKHAQVYTLHKHGEHCIRRRSYGTDFNISARVINPNRWVFFSRPFIILANSPPEPAVAILSQAPPNLINISECTATVE